jgi:hypothetical protein
MADNPGVDPKPFVELVASCKGLHDDAVAAGKEAEQKRCGIMA